MLAANHSAPAPRPSLSPVTDRSYWLGIARVHHTYGNRSGFLWALDNARRAPVLPDFTAARLAYMDQLVKEAA